MKKTALIIATLLFALTSCSDDDNDSYPKSIKETAWENVKNDEYVTEILNFSIEDNGLLTATFKEYEDQRFRFTYTYSNGTGRLIFQDDKKNSTFRIKRDTLTITRQSSNEEGKFIEVSK